MVATASQVPLAETVAFALTVAVALLLAPSSTSPAQANVRPRFDTSSVMCCPAAGASLNPSARVAW